MKKQITTTLKQIAQTAPIGVWFTKQEFAEATGIGLRISGTRLWVLSAKEKLITQKAGKGGSVLYFISEVQQRSMASKGEAQRASKGKRKPVEQVTTRNLTEAEAILKKAGLL